MLYKILQSKVTQAKVQEIPDFASLGAVLLLGVSVVTFNLTEKLSLVSRYVVIRHCDAATDSNASTSVSGPLTISK